MSTSAPDPFATAPTAVAVTYRRATAADVGALVALIESAYRGESSREGWTTEADVLGGQRTDPNAVGAIIATPRALVLLAEAEAEGLVACCQLEQRVGAVAYFGMFAVRPGAQGRGIGGRLLAEAEQLARAELGASTLQMTVIRQREDLIAWYQRLGFEATEERVPFPYGDERYGLPRRDDLEFVVLSKALAGGVA